MRWLPKFLVVPVTIIVVGLLADHLVITRALAHGTPEYAVRLAAAMTGLFAGGVAGTLLTVALLLRRTKP